MLATYQRSDLVSRCAAVLLKEITAAPDLNAPIQQTVLQSAETVVQSIGAEVSDELSLAQGLTLVSILTVLRMAVVYARGNPSALEACNARLLARLRDFYPSHRDNLEWMKNYGRMAEKTARQDGSR